MLAFIRLSPKWINTLNECLSGLSPGLQVLCIVLFLSSIVFFFVGAGLIEREKDEKKKLTPSAVCFVLFTLLISGSLIVLALGCS